MNRPENVDFILKDIKSNILDNYVYFLEKRIDKAIEWIKEDYDGGYFECGEEDIKKLLEILGDKE